MPAAAPSAQDIATIRREIPELDDDRAAAGALIDLRAVVAGLDDD